MLQRLPHLSDIALGIISCFGSELHYNFPDTDQWEYYVTLPPLGSMTALTHLRLVGMVDLPPDFPQLSSLKSLVMNECLAEDDGPLNWGSTPLTGLVALTSVEIRPCLYVTELPGAINWPLVLGKKHCNSGCAHRALRA